MALDEHVLLQMQKMGAWLIASSIALLIMSTVLDLAIVLFGPMWVLCVGILFIAITFDGLRQAIRPNTKPRVRWQIAMVAPAGLLVALPLWYGAMRLGNYLQPQIILQANLTDYEAVRRSLTPEAEAKMRSLSVTISGNLPSRLVAFSYGGFLSIGRDIVYDPTDAPSTRMAKLVEGRSSCVWLRDHYWDCTSVYG